jgi:uncharacterized protein YjbI with pentapeptide repeats
MANEEQLSVLKKGFNAWNPWRDKNLDVNIDLIYADLSGTDLTGTDLTGANLTGADLTDADLTGADLTDADLTGADLTGANLSNANLNSADLIRATLSGAYLNSANLSRAYLNSANLSRADLSGAILNNADLKGADLTNADLIHANLGGANLRDANLRDANLSRADLRDANLSRADLSGADFSGAILDNTNLGNIDLRKVKNLDKTFHYGPSTIGTDTLEKSKGQIPDVFLRGCGLSDWEIEQSKLYNPDLSNDEFIDIQNRIFDLRQRQAIQISPLFISYSHSDGAFVDRLDKKLKELGVRFWRDIHDMKAGKIEKQIDRAIRQNPTVVIVLSEYALNSDWVEHEVVTARELEKNLGRDVLCPVALDDSWNDSRWEKRLMEQVKKYNILDFSKWRDDSQFEGIFRKLIDGLQLFYKK